MEVKTVISLDSKAKKELIAILEYFCRKFEGLKYEEDNETYMELIRAKELLNELD